MIRVLHVDDEPSFLELVAFFLQREADFEIVTSLTAQDALQKLKGDRFDAIVADYALPEINGIDLLKILRTQGNDIPYILLTGRGREEIAAEALNNGADFYLQKGTNPQLQFATLAHVIRQSVRRRQSEIESRATERFLLDIIYSIQDGISVLDKDFTIVKVNPTMEKWFAHKVPLVGKKCYEAYHDRDSTCPICPTVETLKTGKSANDVIPKIGTNGEKVGWFDLFSFPMLDSKTGELTGVIEYVRDITDRRKAEQSLNEALERYKELEATINKSPVVIILWPPDPQAPETFVSNSISQFGYHRDDFAPGKMVFEDIIHPDDLPRVREEVAEYLSKGGDELQEQYRIVTKSNEIRWIVDHTFARRGPDGKPSKYESLLIDVTPRKLAQEGLEELTSSLQAIVRAFPDLYFIVRLDGTILEYKTSQDKDLYVPPNEFLGKRLQEVLPPDVGEAYRQMVSEVVKDGGVKTHEYSLEIDGEKRFFEGRVAPMAKDRLMVVVRNITDRKKAEEALRSSERKYKQLVDLAQEGIWMIDAKSVTTFANPRLAEMLGYNVEEMVGRPVFDFIDERNVERLRHEIEIRKTGLKRDLEMEFRRKDGNHICAHLGAVSLLGKEGEYLGGLAVVTDISDRKRNERALESANQKLNLLGHVTRHDSLNQLSVLMGWLGVVQETVKEPPISDHLAAMKKAALAIQKELEFTADYESVGVDNPVWLDVNRACKQGLMALNLEGVSVAIDLDGIEILADPMLDKVFHNLVDNSMRHGKKVTKIRIHSQVTKDGLTLIYEDDGVGVPLADKERVFFRGEGKHTGYGLDLIKGILDITSIKIRETGTPGKGARFELLVNPGNYRTVPKRA